MNKIVNLLNIGSWILHSERLQSGLDYLSRIDGEEGAWYFWLKGSSGVYELKQSKQEIVGDCERSTFALKYYPAIEESAFEDFSCVEQIVRLGEFFEQGNVSIPENVDVCPCCGGKYEENVGHHQCHEHSDGEHIHLKEHNVERPKGIPKMQCRKQIPDELFQIASIGFIIEGEHLKDISLETQDYCRSYAMEGILIQDAQGDSHELVKPGEIDRNIMGNALSRVFHEFLKKNFLASLGICVIDEIETVGGGFIIQSYKDSSKTVDSSEVKKIIIKNIVRKEELR